MFLLFALLACVTCPEGQVRDPLGNCLESYQPAGSPEEALERLPDCTSSSGDGALEIDGACADGACAGMTWSEANAALGETGSCDTVASDASELYCVWRDEAIAMFFSDGDYDGVPDPESRSTGLFVDEGYPGRTVDGLGPGESMRCFLDVLGQPPDEDIGWDVEGDAWYLVELYYGELGLFVNDYSWDGPSDGRADGLSLFGAR